MKNASHRKTALLGLAVATALGLPAVAGAAALTYLGVATQNWNSTTTWNQGVVPQNGDTLTFASTTGNRTTTNDIVGLTLNGITIPGNAYNIGGNSVTMAGDIAFTAGATNQSTLALPVVLGQAININVGATTGSGRFFMTGAITGGFGITKTGPGPLWFNTTAKNYDGDTTVLAGTLDLAVNIPNGAGKGDLIIDLGATVNNNNSSLSVNALKDGPNGGGNITRSATNSRSWSIGNGNASGSFSGNISNVAGTTSSVNKDGTGTQVLGGTITTTAALGANNGRLILNGTSSQGVSVAAAGTLGGRGTIGGTTAVTGKLAPGGTLAGESTAVLAVNILTLNAASTTQITIAGPTRGTDYDALNVAGALTYGGTLALSFPSLELTPGGVYDLFNAVATPGGNFAGVTVNGTVSLTNNAGTWTGSAWPLSLSFVQSTGDLTVGFIPEPSSAGMLAAALPLVARRRRRA